MKSRKQVLLNALVVFMLLNDVFSADETIEICFPKQGPFKNYFPEKITPTSENDTSHEPIYSVSNNQRISRPIVAFLCTPEGKILRKGHPLFKLRPKYFNISSVPEEYNDPTSKESEPDKTGSIKLCQLAANEFELNDPRRFYSENFRKKCSSESPTANATTIPFIPIRDSYLIAQGLYHSITGSVSVDYYSFRQFKLSAFVNGESLSVFTNPIKIYNRIAKLKWVKKPDDEVEANHPFTFSLEIVDQNGTQIKTGLDSSLIVEVTIGYQAKTFMQGALIRDFLYNTDAELAGDEVITSFRNYDQVLHKRATNGRVKFNDVVIRDVYNDRFLFLNATLLVPRSGDRQPQGHSDFSLACLEFYELKNEYFYFQFCDATNDCTASRSAAVPNYRLYNQTATCEARDKIQSVTFAPLRTIAQVADHLKLLNLNFFSQESEEYLASITTQNDFNVPSNYEIPGLWIVVLDKDKNRIYSGPDSVLEITAFTMPSNVTLLNTGRTFKTRRGLGVFSGAIADITDEVQIGFSAISKAGKLMKCALTPYTITKFINIAMFGRFNTAGHVNDPEPTTETFAKLAVEDVRNNISQFKNSLKNLVKSKLEINLKVYDTEQKYSKALDMFLSLLEDQQNVKNELIVGLIAFGDNDISFKMKALLSSYQIPVVAYREDLITFTQKNTYETMVCLDWSLIELGMRLGSALQSKWSYIIVIEQEDYPIDYDILAGLNLFKHTVAYQITISNQTNLKKEIEAAKRTGSKAVLNAVVAPTQYILYREAINNKFAPMHGYQWVSIEMAAKHFDFENKHPLCALIPKCTDAFEGMQLMYTSHNVSGFFTDLWYHVNYKFFQMNQADYRGIPSYSIYNNADQFSLGYDAVLTYAYAIEKLLNNNKTLTKHSLVDAVNDLSFEGLTGIIRFGSYGGFRLGAIVSFSSVVREEKMPTTNVLYLRDLTVRWAVVTDNYSEFFTNIWDRKKRNTVRDKRQTMQDFGNFIHVVEVPMACISTEFEKCSLPYKTMSKPNEKRLITNIYASSCGVMSKQATLISVRNATNSNEICLRTELTSSSFYCDGSCGGGRLTSQTATEYKHGVCTLPNECRCRTLSEIYENISEDESFIYGYSGVNCQFVVCYMCVHGQCVAPFKCLCESGWSGEFCDVPECPDGCVNGKCVLPDYCRCRVGYYGSQCNILLPAFIAGILLACIIVLSLLIFCAFWLKKKKSARDAVRNLDWLVEWKDVFENLVSPLSSVHGGVTKLIESPYTLSLIKDSLADSTAHITGLSYLENSALWKGVTCYVKKFDISSLDVNSLLVRAEIKQLQEMKHPNVIRFIGACLTSPNVCLLLEPVPKGSLTEILQNDVYTIGWNFKFSILRDIANGMDYIDKSNIRSHGQLKSKNCLIDNRWTCKVSGFGVPLFRQKIYNVAKLENIYKSMLWTAPELLRTCATPNEVGSGTKAGDIYSFGIILSETCTHDNPFDFELQILSIEELIRILKNFYDHGTMGIKTLLDTHNYDTSKPIRPALIQSHMPELYLEKRGIEDLITITTDEDPLRRPNFQDIIETLNKIHPLKGELVENLIFLLEKYTNHLQDIFQEKVQEVQFEKNKSEGLLNRLLPSAIAEQMTQRMEILPELHYNVTIFFSDIVGFTTIAKNCKPIEVVELLNDLYTAFDSIIETFDAYKLETIGDAYCVASGIPSPATDHYEQIATMALYILSAVNRFPVRHAPLEKLQIRIGIHSGSCVAGVVGVKMPRYCIFGEDVTIASNMEALGIPNTIQISEACAKLLINTGRYYIIFAANLSIKFIGNINAYWLLGKESLDIELPDVVYPTPLQTAAAASLASSLTFDQNGKGSANTKSIEESAISAISASLSATTSKSNLTNQIGDASISLQSEPSSIEDDELPKDESVVD